MGTEKLICYKMTHDDGFAPNPFLGYLTLATCKPVIRRCKETKVGDWISGWTSRTLNGDAIGSERLVYVARITDIIPIGSYWERYKEKHYSEKAVATHSVEAYGDNIYYVENGQFVQIANRFHGKDMIKRDTGGENVLICEEFYYFPVVKFRNKCQDDLSLDVKELLPKVNLGRGHRISRDEKANSNLIESAKKEFEKRVKDSQLTKEEYIKKIRQVGEYAAKKNKP